MEFFSLKVSGICTVQIQTELLSQIHDFIRFFLEYTTQLVYIHKKANRKTL